MTFAKKYIDCHLCYVLTKAHILCLNRWFIIKYNKPLKFIIFFNKNVNIKKFVKIIIFVFFLYNKIKSI